MKSLRHLIAIKLISLLLLKEQEHYLEDLNICHFFNLKNTFVSCASNLAWEKKWEVSSIPLKGDTTEQYLINFFLHLQSALSSKSNENLLLKCNLICNTIY